MSTSAPRAFLPRPLLWTGLAGLLLALGFLAGGLHRFDDSDRERADRLFAQGDYAAARSLYQRALERAPDNDRAARRVQACDRLMALGLDFVRVPPEGIPLLDGQLEAPLYLGRFEVTQAQWQAVMEANPSQRKGPDLPVESVTWEQVQQFLERLNDLAGGPYFRLPTEAEWEFAARAGTSTRWFFGDDEALLDEYAWYQANSGGRPQPVGRKKPNPWGLYDVYGNVWEWCADPYSPDRNTAGIDSHNRTINLKMQTLAKADQQRVNRGGSWGSYPSYTESSFRGKHPRDQHAINLGFRLARALPVDQDH
jgi:tetratricopeptide (TPR) repeat protein